MRYHILTFATALAFGAGSAFGQLTWGVNGAGGTGTWDTTGLNWWNGIDNVAWSSGGEAIFGGTAGAVTLSGLPTS
jgi:hypothetical protein